MVLVGSLFSFINNFCCEFTYVKNIKVENILMVKKISEILLFAIVQSWKKVYNHSICILIRTGEDLKDGQHMPNIN